MDIEDSEAGSGKTVRGADSEFFRYLHDCLLIRCGQGEIFSPTSCPAGMPSPTVSVYLSFLTVAPTELLALVAGGLSEAYGEGYASWRQSEERILLRSARPSGEF